MTDILTIRPFISGIGAFFLGFGGSGAIFSYFYTNLTVVPTWVYVVTAIAGAIIVILCYNYKYKEESE